MLTETRYYRSALHNPQKPMGILKYFEKTYARPSELKKKGVLGISARNADYILPMNKRQFYPRVDDKLLTKSLCLQHQLPVPETYAEIAFHGEIENYKDKLKSLQDFVIKPAAGAGGRGVLVIIGHEGEDFIKSDKSILSFSEIKYHISTVISGLYSLGGQGDTAIVESRIKPHPVFKDISVEGTPDIRVIVYRGIPIMAMLRLPTALSKGRANLHQGAVAAGVELATGLTRGGVWKNKAIDTHPETMESIVGVQVPFWDKILNISFELYPTLELEYFGVDFVLDIDKGPILLEANARPGLAIQIANRIGLINRLVYVDKHKRSNMTLNDKMSLMSAVSGII